MTADDKRLEMVEQFAAMLAVDPGMAMVLAEAMRASGPLDGRIAHRLDRVAVASATLVLCGLATGDMPTAQAVLRRARLQVLDEDGGEA